MEAILQTHETRRLPSLPAERADGRSSTASHLGSTTVHHLTMVDGDSTKVVPLFGPRDGARGTVGADRSTPALCGWLVQSLLLEAIIRDDTGDVTGAAQALEQALELAAPERVVLPFTVDPVPALLERHARCRSTHVDLLAEIFGVLGRHGLDSPPSASEALPESLTEGEARVLRYLPTNLSKREIAQELYVSFHTIKTHMKHIYQKLDAHNRREAVQRARDYGLLGQRSPNLAVAT